MATIQGGELVHADRWAASNGDGTITSALFAQRRQLFKQLRLFERILEVHREHAVDPDLDPEERELCASSPAGEAPVARLRARLGLGLA